MSSSQLLSIATFVFALAAFFYLAALVITKPRLTLPARWIVVVAVVVTTIGILLRWVESYQMGIGHAPLSNLYESLVFFSWTAGMIYLFIEFKYKNALIGAFVTPIAFLAMAYASMSPNISDRIQPLVPALKSNWLIAHVATCFFGYAAFAVAFGMSIMYLVKAKKSGKKRWHHRAHSQTGGSGRTHPPHGSVWLSLSHRRNHYRIGVGQFGLGQLLVMGSQGNLVPGNLAGLCHPASRQTDARLARQADRLSIDRWFFCRAVYLFRCEFVARVA